MPHNPASNELAALLASLDVPLVATVPSGRPSHGRSRLLAPAGGIVLLVALWLAILALMVG